MTDPIADMLTRIRNAHRAKKVEVFVPHSNIKEAIAKILAGEGFVVRVSKSRPRRDARGGREIEFLKITLKYSENREPVIREIARVSKPGHRVYVKKDKIPRVLGGLGIAILSTPRGILTDREARARGVGGELLCRVA